MLSKVLFITLIMLSLLHRTMSNIWVISDTHFRHSNILNFIDHNTGKLVRPMFTDVDAMDEHIIERWNSVVKTGDTVYHLGDVVMGKDKLDWMNNNWSTTLKFCLAFTRV